SSFRPDQRYLLIWLLLFCLGICSLKSQKIRLPKSLFSGIFRVALLFTYQGAFAVFVSCDSFVIIPPPQALVNNFFQEIFHLDFSLSKRLFAASLSALCLSDEFDCITDPSECQHPISKFFYEISQFTYSTKKALKTRLFLSFATVCKRDLLENSVQIF
ncbi:MAG: hypothetical protein IK081_08105, partial [Lachnospiraceae bacterium]|nr:hypothetical protein [Lachnospiraceae bacterium]